jgi:hypothetical protein
MMMMKEQGVLLVALGAIWHSSISLSLSFGFYDWRAQKKCALFLSLNHETSIIILRPERAAIFMGKIRRPARLRASQP